MCSPYDYVQMETGKVGIFPERKSGSRSQQQNLKNFNSNGGLLINFSFIVESILATVKRERRGISQGRKYSGTSFYLSYFFIPIVIVLILGFFPLTNSAGLIHRLQEPNNHLMMMGHQTEKHVLIQRQSILSEDEGTEKDDDVTSSPLLLVMKNGSVSHEEDGSIDSGEDRKTEQRLTTKMGEGKEELNCTQPTILDFPFDLITKIPSSLSVFIHVIISLYIFYAIAYLCHAFFVPSVDLICKVSNVSPDVAGATWMAIATSTPEFFTNVIGTFLTQGGIGVGSVVGSVVFNLLSIIAWCGLFTKVALKLDWWPLTRDLFSYIFSVVLLIIILWDGRIYWYEGLVLVLSYSFYIAIMCNNSRVERMLGNWIWRKEMRMSSLPVPSVDKLSELFINSLSYDELKGSSETTPLLSDKSGRSYLNHHLSDELNRNISTSHPSPTGVKDLVSINMLKQIKTRTQGKEESIVLEIYEKEFGLFELPRGQSCLKWFEWIVGWPVRLILHVTIPDCRLLTYTNWYPVTFCICILYMALFSYIISWMMSVIGQTLGITDSIMGLTFISMGTSLPETISSIIVARQGYGSMGVSNSVGSNTFNILICLGLPWFLRTLMLIVDEAGEAFIPMTEGGFGHISIFLLASALLMYILIVWNDYLLDFKIGALALLLYTTFLVFASLLELNFFFPVNLPSCPLN